MAIVPNVSNKVIDSNGTIYKSITSLAHELGVSKEKITRKFKKNETYVHNGKAYNLLSDGVPVVSETKSVEEILNNIPEYKEFLEYKNVSDLPFVKYDFDTDEIEIGSRYAVALFSDAHIEETVNPNSVLGLNEYNLEIAKERIENYFTRLAEFINEDKVENLLFASLGACLNGEIHPEYLQENGMSVIEATFEAQNIIYNGLRYLVENTNLKKIQFVGIVGNHGRNTRKIQHSNGYKMSYEYLMYKNVEKQCKMTNLPIEFNIPESEMAVVDTIDDRRFVFIHGFQIKGSGNSTVCGIYPALQRLALKYGKTFKQDKIYLGHFHSCTSIPNAVVNGSIIGYNAFALSNGFPYEEPAQMYELYDTNYGQLLTRQIFVK